jgi:uncharacterized protein YabE (DUF348 family)
MNKWIHFLLPLGLIGLGIAVFIWGGQHPVLLTVDDISIPVNTRALFVGQVIAEGGLSLGPSDQVNPSPFMPAFLTHAITIHRVRPVSVLDQDNKVLGSVSTSERFPGNLLLLAASKRLFPGDLLTWNDRVVDLQHPLPPAAQYSLKYIPGIPIIVLENNLQHRFYSARHTLGEALQDAGIVLAAGDWLSLPAATLLDRPIIVTLRHAASLSILVGGKTFQVQSAAETVGQALAAAGIALQNNDISNPSEDQPIPASRSIQVVRVNEEIVLEQKSIPFETETVSSAQVDINQRQVLQPGQPGVQVSRVRVRFENGKEVSRKIESDWIASQPVKQKVAVGTRVPILKLDTPSGPIEYYRSMTVYATSYSPCNSDADRCYNSTANGMHVQRGVIGVTRQWYNLLAGQRVYIPGYGIAVIADVGAGVPGKQWIDLGFSDSDYESWHQNVTLYFLTPIPPNVQWNLP